MRPGCRGARRDPDETGSVSSLLKTKTRKSKLACPSAFAFKSRQPGRQYIFRPEPRARRQPRGIKLLKRMWGKLFQKSFPHDKTKTKTKNRYITAICSFR